MELIIPAHLASTLLMVGLIWTIQLVHYPLFQHVGDAQFPGYHHQHTTRISLLVMPLMVIELCAGALIAWSPPPHISAASAWTALALTLLIWLSTATLQVPAHHELSSRFDAEAHRRLVQTNWVRTALWSARGALVLSWGLR